MPTPTPHNATHKYPHSPCLLTGSTTSESTHQEAVSAAVAGAVSCCTQAAMPVPPGLLLNKSAFTTAFSSSVPDTSVYLSFALRTGRLLLVLTLYQANQEIITIIWIYA